MIRFGDGQPSSPLMFRLYASDLEQAVSHLSHEMQFDTRKISRADLTKAIDHADVEAGSTDRHTSWDGQIMKVDWTLKTPTEAKATPMSITGLQQGAFQTKLAEMRQRVANAQNAGIAKIDATVTKGVADLEEAASSAAAKAENEIADALQEFATITNGGPA